MNSIWRETTTIRFASVDRSDRLTLWSIFNYFQEAAISHAADLGVGREEMSHNGHAWILSRLSLFAERRPLYGETIEISTWPRGWEKLFFHRDYTIRDAEGIAVIRGRGSWLVLDIEKRRPLRSQSVMFSLPPNDGINAVSANPVSLEARENLVKNGDRAALYSDIDFYGHANNARYIQWIQDATDIDVLTDAERIRIDINYLNEVMPGETVEIFTAPLDETAPCFAYEGRRAHRTSADGIPNETFQPVFRAELRTGSAASE